MITKASLAEGKREMERQRQETILNLAKQIRDCLGPRECMYIERRRPVQISHLENLSQYTRRSQI